MLQEIEVLLDTDQAEVRRSPIYSFVPAHGGSRAGAIAESLCRVFSGGALSEVPGFSVLLASFTTHPYSLWSPADSRRRLDGRTWGALVSNSDGLDVLDAREIHPRQLRQVLEFAQRRYALVFADVTGAKETHSLEMLRASECIFVVSSNDHASLEMAREKYEWLQSMDLADQCGLLLDRSLNGLSSDEAEEITGLPLCSLVDREEHINRLAGWLAADEIAAAKKAFAA